MLCKNCKYFKPNGCYKDYGTIYYNSTCSIKMGNCKKDNSLKNELNTCKGDK